MTFKIGDLVKINIQDEDVEYKEQGIGIVIRSSEKNYNIYWILSKETDKNWSPQWLRKLS